MNDSMRKDYYRMQWTVVETNVKTRDKNTDMHS